MIFSESRFTGFRIMLYVSQGGFVME